MKASSGGENCKNLAWIGEYRLSKLAGDFELWTRFAQKEEPLSLRMPLAIFRTRKSSRSKALQVEYEEEVDKAISKLPHRTLMRWLPKNRLLNQLIRLILISGGNVYYYNPFLETFVTRRRWSNMAFFRVSELANFVVDVLLRIRLEDGGRKKAERGLSDCHCYGF